MHLPEILIIKDRGVLLGVPFEACRLYHGEDGIGALALGYRLMVLALRQLSPLTAPDRSEISVSTSFDSPGFRDAFEMTARAVSRGAYRTITEEELSRCPFPAGTIPGMALHVDCGGKRLTVFFREILLTSGILKSNLCGRGEPDSGDGAARSAERRGITRKVFEADAEKFLVWTAGETPKVNRAV